MLLCAGSPVGKDAGWAAYFRCGMDKKVYDNGDVQLTTEFNFDLDKWVHMFGAGGVKIMLKDCNAYLRHMIKLRFMTLKGPGGVLWPKHSPLTLASGATNRLMHKTGSLERSIKSMIAGTEVIIYTKQRYAKLLHTGARYTTTIKQSYWLWANLFPSSSTAGPRGPFDINLPPRPFFGFDAQDDKNIRRIVKKHFKETERMGT